VRLLRWLKDKLTEWLINRSDPNELFAKAVKTYRPEDQYRDFRQVFGTEQGQRVLNQILVWSGFWTTSMAGTTHEMAFSEGERNLGLKILAAYSVEKQQPNEQRRK